MRPFSGSATSPAQSGHSPASTRNSDDLPQPLGPISSTLVPGATSKVRSRTRGWPSGALRDTLEGRVEVKGHVGVIRRAVGMQARRAVTTRLIVHNRVDSPFPAQLAFIVPAPAPPPPGEPDALVHADGALGRRRWPCRRVRLDLQRMCSADVATEQLPVLPIL
jgi:hypothetical protein